MVWVIFMQRLKINKNKDSKGEIRYYIASSIRNGNKSSTHNLIALGKHSDIVKEHPNVEAYLKEVLQQAIESGDYDSSVQVKYSFNRQIKPGDVKQFDIGEIFVRRLFNETKLGDCLDAIQQKHKFQYSLKDIVLFLLAQRLATPFSKRQMYLKAKSRRLNGVSFSLENVYRGMDILIQHKTEILKWLYDHIPMSIDRNYSILYFDGTNTYMETEIEEGLKARGKGKRNEVEPLVSFGLIIDGSGIPLSFVTFKGSGSECKQLIPLEEIIEKDFRNTQFTMITDAALSSKEIRCFNSIADKNFVTVVPVRKMSKEKLDMYIFDKTRPWKTNNPKYNNPDSVLSRYDEIIEKLDISDNPKEIEKLNKEIEELLNVFLTRRYPVLIDKKPIEYRKDAKSIEYIEEDYLISFSLKYALRDRLQRSRLIERASRMIAKEGSKKKYKPGDPRQYVKETSITHQGEIAQETIKELDHDLILKQASLDGYYAVSTSLINENEECIISWMKKRWMIEDTFLLMKQFLGFRPINHSKDSRIDAHFFSVFLTTLYYRYIQKLCNESQYESLKNISDEELFDLLRSFQIIERKDYYYPCFENNQRQQDIQKLFGINISCEIMKKSYLTKEFKKSFSK